ncbi:MAG: hypothetical protein ACOC83_08515 [Gemmatimonadota bacterium]
MAGSGFRGMSSVLLVVALAATAGFLYWVYDQAQTLDQSVTPEMADTTATDDAGGVDADRLASSPEEAIGRDVGLDSLEVAASLGRGVFTVSLNDSVDFPVLMGSELVQQGATVYEGDRVDLEGRVYTFNDSIRTEWVGRGAVDSASVEDLPEVAAFLLAGTLDILE